jgi:hypothetical protein
LNVVQLDYIYEEHYEQRATSRISIAVYIAIFKDDR